MDYPNIHIYDTSVAVWEKGVDEASLMRRVFNPLEDMLRERGWTVTRDPRIDKEYPVLGKWNRRATKGDLIGSIELSGRTMKIEVWQEKYNITHPNGGKYESRKRARMPAWLGRRCDMEMSKVVALFERLTGYPIHDRRYIGETADQFIARDYAESWHTKPDLGRPAFTNGDRDRTSADKVLLEQGQTVWTRSWTGRWMRGQAFYRLNNMWMVRVNRFEILFKACWEIFALPPANPREKTHSGRKRRLETELKSAVASRAFLRAHLLDSVLTREGFVPPLASAAQSEAAR